MISDVTMREHYTNEARIGQVILIDRKKYVVEAVKKEDVYQHVVARKLADNGDYDKDGKTIGFFQSKHKNSGTRVVKVVDTMMMSRKK